MTQRAPTVIHSTLRDALTSYITHPTTPAPAANGAAAASDEAPSSDPARERVAPVVLALSAFSEETKKPAREKLMAQWLVLAHHSSIGEQS